MATRNFGAPIRRNEDARLLRGQALFVDDVELPGMLHAAFLRSPHAHAAIHGIDKKAALAQPGVRAVYSYADLKPHLISDRLVVALPSPAFRQQVDRPVLASTEGSLPEIAGDGALLVDPYDAQAIRRAIVALDQDADLRADLVVRGEAQAARFSVEAYNVRLAELYQPFG